MFLDLVDQVIISILTDWLEMDDLTNFDSAFCNNFHRIFVLNMFSEINFVQTGRLIVCKPDYYNWVGLRKIRVKSLNLSGHHEKKLDKSITQILSRVNHLEYLEMKFCYNLELLVGNNVNKIQHLNLCNSYQLNDDNLSHLLSGIHGLINLDMSGCDDITNAAAEVVVKYFPNLEMISVEHCSQLSTEFIETIARGCLHLKKLSPNTSITDTSLIVVAEHCSKLEYLFLVGCVLITDISMLAVARHCPLLKHLIAKGCSLSDKSVSQIAMNCPLLSDLFIQECDEVTDVSVLKIAECCPFMDCLVLSGCERITDASMVQVAKKCVNLRDVHLGKCSLLTDESVLAFAQYSRRLVMLDVVQCVLITDQAISEVIRQCSNLCHLDIFETQMTCAPLLLMAHDLQYLCVNGRATYEEINKVNVVKLPAGRTQLRALSFNHPQMEVDGDMLLTMVAMSPDMRKLEITGHSMLSDDILTDILQLCPLLSHVVLMDCPELSNSSATIVARSCPLLTALDLSDCPLSALGDSGLIECVKLCGDRLKRLTVANCEGITDESIVEVAMNCPLLEYLDLSYQTELTSVSIKAVAQHCPLLRELHLLSCESLNVSALQAVVQGCACLEVLKLDDSFNQISMRGGRELIQLVSARHSTVRELVFDEYTFVR